ARPVRRDFFMALKNGLLLCGEPGSLIFDLYGIFRYGYAYVAMGMLNGVLYQVAQQHTNHHGIRLNPQRCRRIQYYTLSSVVADLEIFDHLLQNGAHIKQFLRLTDRVAASQLEQ